MIDQRWEHRSDRAVKYFIKMMNENESVSNLLSESMINKQEGRSIKLWFYQ